ncbi:hypothetical protein SERLA73DRAFT_137778 [Serpula lacrymans var. lacrymans S7.3]|uniref:Uncharacterized protein n=1 Tax=Serpula lacrymans var. lacrymans (strain S7.3) TaxID=936435 RepID=F8PXE1_SERL3|nr:hypothetical protein SERLA73DRAFT_137778 [Serpula lacrymans var. lacrymans S7.3]
MHKSFLQDLSYVGTKVGSRALDSASVWPLSKPSSEGGVEDGCCEEVARFFQYETWMEIFY